MRLSPIFQLVAYSLMLAVGQATAHQDQHQQPQTPNTQTLATRQSSVSLNTVLNDIRAIDTNVKALITNTQPIEGRLLDVPRLALIATNFLLIHNANRRAFRNAQRIESPFAETEALAVLELVEETLVVTNPAATKLIIEKKPAFDRLVLVRGFVLGALEELLQDHLELSAALTRFVPGPLAERAADAVDVITVALEEAVATYRGNMRRGSLIEKWFS